jgi:hypothetical protein
MEGKREGQRKAKRHVACMNQRRELILLMVGSYLTHNLLMSPTFKSWDLIVIRGLEQASHANAIFLSIAKAKAHWKAMLTCYLKNWMQKNKDELPPNHLPIMKKTSTLPNEMIHITFRCTMHLCGHQNKMVPLMNPFILVDLGNNVKFHNYTY